MSNLALHVKHAKPSFSQPKFAFQGICQRGGHAQKRAGSRGRVTAPMLWVAHETKKITCGSAKKKDVFFIAAVPTAGLDLPAGFRVSGSLPGSTTAAHEQVWTASTSSSPDMDKKENKPGRNLAHGEVFGRDLSLLSAAGWTRPTLSS